MSELETLELKISKFLRYGVILAGVFLFTGWLSYFSLTSNPFASFKNYNHISLLETVQDNWLNKRWGALFSYSGLIILISLPLIRVFLTAYLFIRQKEFHLAIIASLVLIGLLTSFCLGIEL